MKQSFEKYFLTEYPYAEQIGAGKNLRDEKLNIMPS